MIIELIGGPRDGETVTISSAKVTAITIPLARTASSIFITPTPKPDPTVRLGVYLVRNDTGIWDGEL